MSEPTSDPAIRDMCDQVARTLLERIGQAATETTSPKDLQTLAIAFSAIWDSVMFSGDPYGSDLAIAFGEDDEDDDIIE